MPTSPLPAESPPAPARAHPRSVPRRFVIAMLVLLAGFAWPLFQLFSFSLSHSFYSHIVIIPLVSGYFVWLRRDTLRLSGPAAVLPGAVLLAVGALLLAGYLTADPKAPIPDRLAWMTSAFVFALAGVSALTLGRDFLRDALFPLAFLLFMIPIPTGVELAIELFLQHGSAAVCAVLFKVSGTPTFQSDLVFQLPGISIRVAPECSGLRSTLALMITSVVAAQMFLRSPVRRLVLVALVVPLALVRNGLRIYTIGQLCVYVGPHMIDSPIHHHGGPVFFALSLVPFAFVLRWLIKSERRSAPAAATP